MVPGQMTQQQRAWKPGRLLCQPIWNVPALNLSQFPSYHKAKVKKSNHTCRTSSFIRAQDPWSPHLQYAQRLSEHSKILRGVGFEVIGSTGFPFRRDATQAFNSWFLLEFQRGFHSCLFVALRHVRLTSGAWLFVFGPLILRTAVWKRELCRASPDILPCPIESVNSQDNMRAGAVYHVSRLS